MPLVIQYFYVLSKTDASGLGLFAKFSCISDYTVPFLQVRVANYWEALGVIAAHKAGVDPRALRRNGVSHLHRLATPVHSLGSLKRLEQAPLAMSGVC